MLEVIVGRRVVAIFFFLTKVWAEGQKVRLLLVLRENSSTFFKHDIEKYMVFFFFHIFSHWKNI